MKRTPLAVMLYPRGSQTIIAEAAGCSSAYVSAICKGRLDAADDKLKAIAKAARLDYGLFLSAYLETRRTFLREQLAAVDARLREANEARRAS